MKEDLVRKEQNLKDTLDRNLTGTELSKRTDEHKAKEVLRQKDE